MEFEKKKKRKKKKKKTLCYRFKHWKILITLLIQIPQNNHSLASWTGNSFIFLKNIKFLGLIKIMP